MTKQRTRFVVSIPGGESTLFSIIEKPNGDLTIPIGGTDRVGPDWINGPSISEHRFSIHLSPRSQNYTTIKQTVTASNGHKKTTALLTDAVKKATGFSLIFVRRCHNLTRTPNRPTAGNRNDPVLRLPEFDPSIFTLFHAMFVGHPSSKFDASDDDVKIKTFQFKNFQIALMQSLVTLPSHSTTEFVSNITFPPESPTEESPQAILRFLMAGKSPEICIRQYKNSVKYLHRSFLQRMLAEITNETTRRHLTEEISQIENVSLGQLGLDTNPRSVHMLSGRTPPNLQSQPPRGGFFRRSWRRAIGWFRG